MLHDFDQIFHHLLSNSPDQGGAFRRDADHYLSSIVARDGTHDVIEILESCHQPARCRGGVPHFLGNRGHGKHFFLIEIGQKKKLGERNVSGSKFLAQVEHKTALHFQYDVGKPFGIGPNFLARASGERGSCFRVQAM